MDKKIFDFVIGNPPFNLTSAKTSDSPAYNIFIDACNEVSDKVELIHPARFLFNAGKTPKAWNNKMLNDEHFKVLKYEEDGEQIFPGTDIKGGVSITYHDNIKKIGPIGVFTNYKELNSISQKVTKQMTQSIDALVYAPESYKFTPELYLEHPEIKIKTKIDKYGNEVPLISKGHDYDLVTNIFEGLIGIVFFEKKPNDGHTYIRILGRYKNERVLMWVKEKYVRKHPNLKKWKVALPKANGTGRFGETLSDPTVIEPDIGHNQTFISIGDFGDEVDADNCKKYIMTKFCRTMLGVLKATQDNKRSAWRYVPLQDFTSNSDIDWTKSIHEIDLQLYKKYGLSEDEIEFIESHVKEME